MSTTVSYKGNTIATVENNTKTLTTAGKYLEADVILTDVTSGGGGLEYEEGTWTPSEDVIEPTINFANTHSALPISIVMCDANGTTMAQYTNAVFMYTGLYDTFGTVVTSGTDYYGRVNYMRYSSGATLSTGGFSLTSMTGNTTTAVSYFVSSASCSYFSIWTDENLSSMTTLSEIRIASSKFPPSQETNATTTF